MSMLSRGQVGEQFFGSIVHGCAGPGEPLKVVCE